MSRKNIKIVYSNKRDSKYFLSQSEGCIFANSTSWCSVIGQKKYFNPIFWKMNLSRLLSKLYNETYSVLTIAKYVSQYTFLCCEI